jgi:hypothetical protein
LRKPKTARIETLWLEAVEKLYWTVDDLVSFTGKSKRRIQAGLKRARDEPIEPATVWDIEWRSSPNAFVAAHQCEWHGGETGRIPEGYPVGCLFCLEAGLRAMMARHGRPVGIPTETTSDSNLHPEALQPKGKPKFRPKGAKRT